MASNTWSIPGPLSDQGWRVCSEEYDDDLISGITVAEKVDRAITGNKPMPDPKANKIIKI
jgi:hypothetical protein